MDLERDLLRSLFLERLLDLLSSEYLELERERDFLLLPLDRDRDRERERERDLILRRPRLRLRLLLRPRRSARSRDWDRLLEVRSYRASSTRSSVPSYIRPSSASMASSASRLLVTVPHIWKRFAY